MGTLVRLDRRARERRDLPAYRLAETGMEVQARTHDVRHGLEEISRHAWAGRDPWTLQKISRLLPAADRRVGRRSRLRGWPEPARSRRGGGAMSPLFPLFLLLGLAIAVLFLAAAGASLLLTWRMPR